MKNIRIASLHPGMGVVNNTILGIEGNKFGFNFISTDENPDYVIVTQLVYYNKDIFNRFIQYMNQDCIFIYYAGECISPDLNIFDYAIVFDRHLKCDDRIIRKPTLNFYSVSIFDEFCQMNVDLEMLKSKTGFCNFMYSNPEAHPNRDKLFYILSEYKKVDSLGPHLHNTDVKSSRSSNDWRRLSILARIPYRFSIAAENACFPGYTSEKILSCFQAHTVPIYWGDPTISEEFNTKAFINCHDYNTFDEVLEKVIEIDNNDRLLLNMLQEPWQTDEQVKKAKMEYESYEKFIVHIFAQDKQDAHRLIGGFHPWKYKEWFEYHYNYSLTYKIKTLTKKLNKKVKQISVRNSN